MPIRREYIFTIATAYIKSKADITEINNDRANGKKWKDGYSTFKTRIRRYLKIAQHGRCAFCRCYVSIGTSYSNLEHLVSKSDYEQFEFLPENLVYCCWQCNKGKLVRNTLSGPVEDKVRQQFPTQSNGFVIINPYHDHFEDHIDFFDEVLILSKDNSTKGDTTIDFYNLSRPELAEERAREFKLNQEQLNHQLMQKLTTHSNQPKIINQMHQILAHMPDWTLD